MPGFVMSAGCIKSDLQQIDPPSSRHENIAMASARTGVFLCMSVSLQSSILAFQWGHLSERRMEVYSYEITLTDETLNLLCIFMCEIVLVKERFFVLVYVLCLQLLSSSDSGVFLHRCYFSRPTVIPKCFAAECLSKQSSLVPQALFTRALCHTEV